MQEGLEKKEVTRPSNENDREPRTFRAVGKKAGKVARKRS